MSISKKLIGCTTILLALLATVPAAATLFVRVADEDLAARADIIAEVTVRDSSTGTATVRPSTELTLDVVEWIAGEERYLDESLTVRLPGGATADGMQIRYAGIPELEPGQQALVFLKATAQPGTFKLLHLMQGFFHLTHVDGQKMAYRHFEGASEVSLPGRKALAPELPRDFSRFTAWLRDDRAGSPRAADYWLESAAAESEVQSQVEKFTLFENSGFNMRYREFDTGGNVRWLSHNSGQPGLPSGGHPEFQAALASWTNDPGTPINLRYGGQTGATAGFGSFDGINAILWDDLAGDIDEPFSCTEGGTLAIGGPWFVSSDRHSFQGTQFITILGGDIVTNSNLECFIATNNRAAEVFAHELGHTLGLGHSCGDAASGSCNTSAKNDALMRATAHGDGRGARLGSDDRAGIGFLYGAQLTAPTAPSNLQAAGGGIGVVNLTWNDNSSNETSFLIERRVNGGGFSQIAAVSSGSRAYTDSNATSGSISVYRVRASNSAGSSAYTNQATVNVQGSPPPGNLAVQILSATEARLTWVDNASDETGYEIEADGFGTFLPAGTAGPDATEATINGLQPATDYTFRVRSVGGPSGASSYVTTTGTTLPGSPEACQQDATTLCLNQGRFKVQVAWRDFENNTGPGSRVDLTSTDSGVFWFFGPDNWEMLVKVLDGCGVNGHFWVFAAATTNVEFTLVVTDTLTGAVSVHENELGVSAPAITDTSALPVCTGGSSTAPAPVNVRRTDDPEIQVRAVQAELSQVLKADCTDDDTTLCLNSERFQVRATWTDFEGNSDNAQVVELPVVSDDSGLLWFFGPDNWEVLIKVLNACDFNNRYWVFSAATTNVAYTIEVTDSLTGDVRTYRNTLGESASAVTDTDAFATCP